MRIVKFRWENVRPDGTFETGQPGAVGTEGGVKMSAPQGGCGLDGCHCSDGHWICISKPRTKDGIVEGETIYFENHAEMAEYIKSN